MQVLICYVALNLKDSSFRWIEQLAPLPSSGHDTELHEVDCQCQHAAPTQMFHDGCVAPQKKAQELSGASLQSSDSCYCHFAP